MEDKVIITGKIIFQKYQNENFSILVVRDILTGEQLNVKGYNLPDNNFTYKFEGKITEDEIYGKTLTCEFCEIFTSSRNNMMKYLSKTIDGIEMKTAAKFFDMFGADEVLNAIKNKEKIALIVKNQNTIEKIYNSALTNLVDRELYFLLLKYDIPIRTIPQITDVIPDAKKEIEKNPFCLAKFGIPFSKMNKMAIDFQVKLKSTIRICCAIHYLLKDEICSRGHLYAYFEDAVEETLKILNKGVPNRFLCNTDNVKQVLHKMRDNGSIKVLKVNEQCIIYNASIYEDEMYIAERIVELTKTKPAKQFSKDEIEKYIQKYEKIFDVNLSDEQKLAVLTVMNENVAVITGSAGTGKTTVIKFCIEIFNELFDTEDVALLAPTGRAARRMTEATEHPAFTIHSKLGIGEGGETSQMIEEQLCIADEMSMTGNGLTVKMLNNALESTRFFFFGDPQQLPSVEAGNILMDLINSEVIPVVKLKVIFRQHNESHIILNANNITAGISDFKTGDDFEFVDKKGSIEIQKSVLDVFCNEFFNRVKDLNEVQIIAPMREKGYLSAKSLNLLIQKSINPNRNNSPSIKCNGYEFRIKDKVICQKNTEEVKNGEIGIITNIFYTDNKLTAEIDFYGERLYFDKDQLKDLKFVLAYAITVHKSQGSEFKSVILPINNENKIMLKRNLLYTAVTRASEKMIIVGSQKHYWDAVKNNVVEKRNTLLSARLKQKYCA